ncbi:MAG: Ig-like domain repeat protein [Acidobacteriaceae bacterium]|nr:Ig-like domain repeat protein [Acidobacteriaceae bacterium]
MAQTSPAFTLASTSTTFASTALGASSSLNIQVKTTRAVTIASVAIASSVNNHQEFAAGTMSGCSVGSSAGSGSTCTIPVTFTPFYSGNRTGALTLTDSTGTVYTVGLNGLGDGPQSLLTPTSVSTEMGASGGVYYSGDGGAASSARLGLPEGVAVDASNNVYIADYSTQNIRVIYQSGAALACLIQIENPSLFGLAAGSTSCANATSAPTAGSVYTLAGDTTPYTTSTTHTKGSTDKVLAASVGATTLYGPTGVAVDKEGNVLISNYTGYNLRVIYSGGANMACLIELEQPTTFGLTTGATSCSGATSAPIPGYIYDLAGSGTSPGITGDGGLASSATMTYLNAVAVDTDGDIFVVDYSSQATRAARMRLVYNGGAKAAALITATNPSVTAPVRGYIYKIMGGVQSSSGDGGIATSAGFVNSRGVTVDRDGDVIFTDYNTSSAVTTVSALGKVRVIYNGGAQMATLITAENPGTTLLPGYVYTLAGASSDGTTASGNGGPASAARFITPYGVTLDPAGDIFVADYGDRTIRKISIADGNIYPYAGTSGVQGIGLGNSLTTGTLWDPYALALGSSGTLFEAEYGVYRIRSVGITASDITFTTAVPAGSTGTPTFVYLTNFGTEPLTISAVTASTGFTALSPDSTSLYSTDCTKLPTLQPGASCAVGAALQPTTNGTTLTGTLTVTDNSSNSTAANHTVNLSGVAAYATTTTLTSSNLSVNAGSSVTLTATVAISSGQDTSSAPALSGSVTFTDGTTTLGTVTIDSTGTATMTDGPLTGGNHTIKATYTPDDASSDWYASSSASITEAVTAVATTTTLTSSHPNAGTNVSITFTAKSAIASGATVPSGTPAFAGSVTFTDGTTTLGTSAIDSTGTAIFTTSTLALGSHTITATFTPTTINYASSSATYTQVIAAPSFTATTTSTGVAVTTGLTTQIPFTISGIGSYSGTVKGSCSSLPANMSCSFIPSSVTFTGQDNSASIAVNLIAYATSSSLRTQATEFTFAALLGGGLLFFLPRRRRLPAVLMLVATCGITAGLSGCGNGTRADAPRGTSNINVTFTDGTTSYTTTITVSVLGSTTPSQ